jgi:hypothetical protein
VLQARVREEALPGECAPEERDGDGERHEPEADEDALRHVLAHSGSERAVGSPRDDEDGWEERAREESGHGRRRFGVCVREPVVDRRPSHLGSEAGEEEHERDRELVRPRVERCQRLPRETAQPALHVRRDEHDPEERKAEPEGREHEVLPAGLECRRSSAESDEERRGGRGGLDQEPGDSEVPRKRHRDEHGPEREQRAVVQALPALGAHELRPRDAEVRG